MLLPCRAFAIEPGSGESAARIELHKSFRAPARPESGVGSPPDVRAGIPAGGEQGAGRFAAGDASRTPGTGVAAALAEALDETLVTSGTMHLPGVGGRGLTLDAAATPLVDFATGRRVVLDPSGSIASADAAEIRRLWPAFAVLGRTPGQGTRELLDALLASSGYASVLRDSPVRFGRAASVRLRPDFVILKRDGDLLDGATRTLTVVGSAAERVPGELRELAARHRIIVTEVDEEGRPLSRGPDPWRDPAGRVTTVECRSGLVVFAELAEALGLEVERRARIAGGPGSPEIVADLRIAGGDAQALLFASAPDASTLEALAAAGAQVSVVPRKSDLKATIGVLLERFGIAAIGPVVEFSRPAAPGIRPRFEISVPGWLAIAGGRRLLVTDAEPPEDLRLYLAREGIDIFAYRVR